jgi:TonB family protein
MRSGCTTRSITAGVVVIASLSWALQTVAAQRGAPPRVPLPQGQRIDARDGDTVTVEDDARVRIVRRRQAVVRAVFNPTERSVILLFDYASPRGADGRVDSRHSFTGISGLWPLPERWEGMAVVEQYQAIQQPSSGVGLRLPQGLIQILGPMSQELFKDESALAVLSYKGATGGMEGAVDFDEAERRQLSDIARNRSGGAQVQGGVRAGVVGSFEPEVKIELRAGPVRDAPLRVGGSIRMPEKIYDAPAVYPETARQAGIRGVVILELTIGPEGTVTAAKVLRGQPLLDEAAVEAVKQWRFEPTLLNGKPVPVIFTATVSFNP